MPTTIESYFADIADAIRKRGDTSAGLTPAQMPQAILDIPGGGGEVELLTQSQWDTLSTAEKQAKGLVAIEQAVSGYNRGILVNGADFQPVGDLLIYSDPTKIACEADYTMNVINGRWGIGPNAAYAAGCTIETNSLYAPVAASEARLYVDLGASDTPFTAYAIMKLRSPGTYTRLLSAMRSRAGGEGIILYGSTINVSSWGSDTSTGYQASQYHAMAIKWGGSTGSGGMVHGGSWISKNPSHAGQYVTVARTDIDASTSNAEPGNADVLFFGVVTESESTAIVQNNLSHLAQLYLS